jgi:hypothetical protein
LEFVTKKLPGMASRNGVRSHAAAAEIKEADANKFLVGVFLPC